MLVKYSMPTTTPAHFGQHVVVGDCAADLAQGLNALDGVKATLVDGIITATFDDQSVTVEVVGEGPSTLRLIERTA